MGLRWSSTISLQAADHPIESVTIFRSATGTAEITRSFAISLQKGKNVVNFQGISSCIDIDSPRIRVLSGPSHVRVSDICCSIEQVAAKRDVLVADRKLRQQEYDRLVDTVSRLHMSHAHAHVQSTVRTSSDTRPKSDVDDLLGTLVQCMRTAMNALHKLDREILELEQKLSVAPEARKGDGSTVISATIHTEEVCEIGLQLTYLVSGARWEPHYDLHVQTADERPCPDVSIRQNAKITQSTGEDWTDTEIFLSTSNSQTFRALSVPSLDPIRILEPARLISPMHMHPLTPGHPLVHPPGGGLFHLSTPLVGTSLQTNETQAVSDDAFVHVLSHSDPNAHPVAPSLSATKVQTQADLHHGVAPPASLGACHVHGSAHPTSAPLSRIYHVGEGESVTVPSDGLAHTFTVATLQFCAELEYVSVPRKSSAVLMQARMKNTGANELLPGPVSVFFDGKFVAKSALNHVGLNKSFECIIGVDTKLKVSYHQREHVEMLPIPTDGTKTIVYIGSMKVTNDHDLDIANIVIRDAVPQGDEDHMVKVTLRRPDGLGLANNEEEVQVVALTNPETETGIKARWTKVEDGRCGKEDGMYEWICGIRARTEFVLEAEWVVTAPRNVEWAEDQGMDLRSKAH